MSCSSNGIVDRKVLRREYHFEGMEVISVKFKYGIGTICRRVHVTSTQQPDNKTVVRSHLNTLQLQDESKVIIQTSNIKNSKAIIMRQKLYAKTIKKDIINYMEQRMETPLLIPKQYERYMVNLEDILFSLMHRQEEIHEAKKISTPKNSESSNSYQIDLFSHLRHKSVYYLLYEYLTNAMKSVALPENRSGKLSFFASILWRSGPKNCEMSENLLECLSNAIRVRFERLTKQKIQFTLEQKDVIQNLSEEVLFTIYNQAVINLKNNSSPPTFDRVQTSLSQLHKKLYSISEAVMQDWLQDEESCSEETLRDWWAHYHVGVDRELKKAIDSRSVKLFGYHSILDAEYDKQLLKFGL